MKGNYPVKINRKQNEVVNINRKNNIHNLNRGPFSSNLSNNMNFGTKGDALSGYVKREMVFIDAKGNKQMAREIQFFNSGKNLGRVEINHNKTHNDRK